MPNEQASETRVAACFFDLPPRLIHRSCGQGVDGALLNYSRSTHDQQFPLPQHARRR
jgi:hypothetical protein